MRRDRVHRVAVVVGVALLLGATGKAAAHGMRTVYVELAETAPGQARVAIRGSMPVAGVELIAAPPCAVTASPDGGNELECPDRLAGAALTVAGLGPIASEAVIFVAFLDGGSATTCVTARVPTWHIPGAADPGMLAVAVRYVRLGIEHIASGADHLLFLLALVLCLRRLRAVVVAETAFTLSHSLSFSATALGWIRVSPGAAEACIAVSLVLVALDVGRPSGDDLRPWRTAGLAFAFGLVHGLGFAGGLAEIGLPATAVPAALAGFAGGVEIGQVAFLAIAVAALALVERVPRLERIAVGLGGRAIGGIGCFWLLARLGALR